MYYTEITTDHLDEIRDVISDYNPGIAEVLEALIEARNVALASAATPEATYHAGQIQALEASLAEAEAAVVRWRDRYQRDVVRLTDELREARKVQPTAAPDVDDTNRNGLTDEELQFTAQLRLLIDQRVGAYTPRRIRAIAEGVDVDDYTTPRSSRHQQD